MGPKENALELAQVEETSAFSEVTTHQIEDSLDSCLGQVEGNIFYLIPQVLLPRDKKRDVNLKNEETIIKLLPILTANNCIQLAGICRIPHVYRKKDLYYLKVC